MNRKYSTVINISSGPVLPRLIFFLMVLLLALASAARATAQTGSDSWVEEMKNARGLTAGDLAPKYGDMTGSSSVTDGTDGNGNNGRSAGTGAGISGTGAGPVDPNRLDPGNPQAAGYIQQWIAMAEPPENATEGANLHYSNRGNLIGTVRGGIISSPHETGGFDPHFLWTNMRKLDSINHCTMEEYVVARLAQEPIDQCRGRYAAVRDLTGIKLSEAKTAITGKGLTYTLAPGSPAKAPEEDGTVEKQEPGPAQHLKKGAAITLYVHSPYVAVAPELPDFAGKPLAEAKKWLQDNGLSMELQPGSPALSRELSGTVESQEPEPGTQLAAGGIVTLAVHADFVDVRLVPDVTGLPFDKARERLESAGLTVELQPGSQPSSRQQEGAVERQEPSADTQTVAGTAVVLFVYGPYADSATVPDVSRLSFEDARRTLESTGLVIKWQDGGKAPSSSLANSAARQEPESGTLVESGLEVQVWFYGQYTPSREELIANYDCSRILDSHAAWDSSANEPRCFCPQGLTLNRDKTGCVSLQAATQEVCEGKWPGSGTVAVWSPERNVYECGCPNGLEWDLNKRYCISLVDKNQLICESKWPGSIANGFTNEGKINCECPAGLKWNNNSTRCISENMANNERCARDYPGTIANGYRNDGKVNCTCPPGLAWDSRAQKCVQPSRQQDNTQACDNKIWEIKMFVQTYNMDRQRNTLQKQMAENLAREAGSMGCSQNAINSALGGLGSGSGSGGGSGGSGGNSCPPGMVPGTKLGTWGQEEACVPAGLQ